MSEAAVAQPDTTSAYRERAHLVAFLARVYPSVIGTDPAEPDWPVVYVKTPEGQMSWHISRDDMDLFGHVPDGGCVTWDGLTTEQKYERLRALTARRAPDGPAEPEKLSAAVIEIIERGRSADPDGPGSIVLPTEVRINGHPVYTTGGGVKIHETSFPPREMATVTMTLPVRRLTIAAEGDL